MLDHNEEVINVNSHSIRVLTAWRDITEFDPWSSPISTKCKLC